MANWLTQESSLLLGVQDDYTTPHGTLSEYKAIRCEKPTLTTPGNVSRLDTLDGVTGSAQAVIVGSKHGGELSFKMPLSGFNTGYSSSSDVPGTTAGVVPEWLCLAANMLGSGVASLVSTGSTLQTDFWKGVHLSAVPYGSGNLSTGSTPSLLDMVSGTGYEAGQFVGADGPAGGVEVLAGWIKSKAAAACTLFEALDDVGAPAGDTHGAVTAYMSAAQPRVLCAYYTGDDTTDSGAGVSQAYRLTGLVGQGFSISLEAGETPMVEFRYYYTDREQVAATGLVAPSSRPRVAPLLGNKGGALRIDGTKRCGISGFSIELECTTLDTNCHSAPQGVSAAIVTSKTVKVSASIPWDSTDTVTAGVHLWENRLDAGTATAVSVATGLALGGMLGVLVPSARQVEYPAMTDADGRLSYDLTMEGGAYTGDGTGDDSANTVFRIGMA